MALVGTATVSIRAVVDKVNDDIRKQIQDAGFDKIGEDAGGQFSDGFKRSVVDAFKDGALEKAAEDAGKSVNDGFSNGIGDGLGNDVVDAANRITVSQDNIIKSSARMRKSNDDSIGSFRNFLNVVDEFDQSMEQGYRRLMAFGGGFSGLVKQGDAFATMIGGAIGGITNLAGGLFALGSAIAPAVYGLGVIPALLSAIALPVAGAAIGFSELRSQMELKTKAMSGDEEAMKQWIAVQATMSDSNASAINSLDNLKANFTLMRDAVFEGLIDPFAEALTIFESGGFFGVLQDVLVDSAEAFGEFTIKVAELTSSDFFKGSFNTIGEQSISIFDTLGDVFINIAEVLTAITEAAGPTAQRFADWIAQVTGAWAATVKTKEGMDSLKGAIEDGGNVLATLGDIIGNIFGALEGLGGAARESGDGLLKSFQDATQAFEDFATAPENQQAFKTWFENAAEVTRELGDVVVVLVEEFGKFGTASSGDTIRLLQALGEEIIPKFAGAIRGAMENNTDAFITLLENLADLSAALGGNASGLTSFITVISGFVDVLAEIMSIPGVNKIAGILFSIGGAFKAFKVLDQLTGAKTIISGISSAIGGFQGKELSGAATGAQKLGAAVGNFVRHPVTNIKQIASTVGGALVKGIKGATLAFKKLGAAMVANPIGIVIAVIGLLVAAFIYLWNNSEGFRNFFIGLWEAIKTAAEAVAKWFMENLVPWFQGVWDGIKSALQAVGDFFSSIWGGIQAAVDAVAQWFVTNLLPIIQGVWDGIAAGLQFVQGIFETVWNAILNGVTFVWDLIVGGIQLFLQTVIAIIGVAFGIVREIFEAVWNFIGPFVMAVWDGIVTGITTAINFIQGIITTVWTAVSDFFITIWTAISDFFRGVWDGIVTFVTAFINAVMTEVTTVWNAVKTTFTTVWNAISSFFSGIWTNIYNTVSTILSDVWNFISNIFNTVSTFVTNTWNSIYNAIKTPVTNAYNWVRNQFNNISNFVHRLFGTLSTWISGVWDTISDAIGTAVRAVRDTIVNVWDGIAGPVGRAFRAVADAITGAWGGITSTIRGVINGIIGVINSGIRFLNRFKVDIPGPLQGIVGASQVGLNIPKIPTLAKGGVVGAQPGGTLALLAEAGRNERVEPLDDQGLSRRDRAIINMLTEGKVGDGPTIIINPPAEMDINTLAKRVSREIAYAGL